MVEWSWTAWAISVAAVVASGALAWRDGAFADRPGLAIGFANHGGMWGDLLLLPMANAAIVPHLIAGWWIAAAAAVATAASVWAHIHWYRPNGHGDHMWPAHTHGHWWRDLSRAGRAHVLYVIGELTLLGGFLLHSAPERTVIFVAAVFTVHVPIGLLQPRWYTTGHIATVAEQPLLAPLLLALWAVTMMKL